MDSQLETSGMERGGNIDEKGNLKGFARRGFTPPRCLNELVANSMDSHDKIKSANLTKMIVFNLQSDRCSMIDNAAGMTREGCKKMFSLNHENHFSDKSRGVSGIGAKLALSILSEKSTVIIFTRTPGGQYECIIVPWREIHSKGIYTGMIQFRHMTDEEIASFCREREENGMLDNGSAHGTTIVFPNTSALRNVISRNFTGVNEDNTLENPGDRLDIVFGHDMVKMVCKRSDVSQVMETYNYFGNPEVEFYGGISKHTVELWYSDTEGKPDRFILNREDGTKEEILPHGKNWSRDLKPSPRDRNGYTHIGNFEVICGMRVDTSLFDPTAPVPIDSIHSDNRYKLGTYNKKYLGEGESAERFLFNFKLFRNGQLIGLIERRDVRMGSSRASLQMFIDYILVQTEIHFNPVGTHDNHQDLVIGIQENKNQFDGTNVPVQLTRVISALKKEKATEIQQYFKECLEAHAGSEASSEYTSDSEEETPVAVAPAPVAIAPAPVAVAPVPVAPVPVAVAPAPVAVAPVPVPVAPAPIPITLPVDTTTYVGAHRRTTSKSPKDIMALAYSLSSEISRSNITEVMRGASSETQEGLAEIYRSLLHGRDYLVGCGVVFPSE